MGLRRSVVRLRPVGAALAAIAVVAVVGVVFGGGARAGASAPAPGPYPVSYDFLLSAVAAGAQPDADPPGANDWSCRPSVAHPEPVVLVHGTGGNKNDNWQTYAPLLADNGYCVYSLTYGTLSPSLPLSQVGGLGPIEGSAAQLGAFVTRVRAATGAAKVDIVGHSQGTLMPDYYAKFLGGAGFIDKYVSLAPLWHGTNLGGTATLAMEGKAYGFPVPEEAIGAGAQMLTGSDLLARMDAGGGPALPGITYTNIVSEHDELVVPYTSGIQAGMRTIVLQQQCALDETEHFEIAADPIASVDVLNALDPAHPRPVPCELVLPFVGPLIGS